MLNEITANLNNSVLHSFLQYVTSGYAMLIYAVIILVLVACAVISLMVGGDKNRQLIIKSEGARLEAKPEEQEEKEEETQEEVSRFDGLTRIDGQREKYKRTDYKDDITLKRLCETFRNFSANKLKLYYDISDIRRFIAGMAVSHILILQGMSGTGKTSLAYAFGEFLDNTTTVIPVQPMWKERTDLIGYYNEFTKRFNETDLLKKMYEANYSKDIYVTVLDEMNIARVEYYFAEFLSLLELPDAEKRNLSVVSDEWETTPNSWKGGT